MAKIILTDKYHLETTDYGYTLFKTHIGKDSAGNDKIHTKADKFFPNLEMALKRVTHLEMLGDNKEYTLGKYVEKHNEMLATLLNKVGAI